MRAYIVGGLCLFSGLACDLMASAHKNSQKQGEPFSAFVSGWSFKKNNQPIDATEEEDLPEWFAISGIEDLPAQREENLSAHEEENPFEEYGEEEGDDEGWKFFGQVDEQEVPRIPCKEFVRRQKMFRLLLENYKMKRSIESLREALLSAKKIVDEQEKEIKEFKQELRLEHEVRSTIISDMEEVKTQLKQAIQENERLCRNKESLELALEEYKKNKEQNYCSCGVV